MDEAFLSQFSRTVTIALAGGAFDEFVPVYSLLKNAFAEQNGVVDPPSSVTRLTVDDVIADFKTGSLLVAESEDELVGCAFTQERRADFSSPGAGEDTYLYFYHMAVSPDWRRRGIAGELLGVAETVARQQGLPGIFLQSRIELTGNHALFEKHGYQQVGTFTHPGFDRPTSLTFLKLL